MFPIFIGYDPREHDAYLVCRASIERRSKDVSVIPLKQSVLRARDLYRRRSQRDAEGRMVDSLDLKPFSTQFSFTRFLVPALADYRGRAMFVDCDFLFRADVWGLLELCVGDRALWCVKHDHRPPETIKMDGVPQEHYRRKNWSSLMVFDCARNRALTVGEVNRRPGAWLHAMSWLRDEEIGALPAAWNWLEGWSPKEIDPKAVHFTRGTPSMPGYEGVPYAKEWRWELANANPRHNVGE